MIIRDFTIVTCFKKIYEYLNPNLFDLSFFSFDNIYYTDNIEEDTLLFCTPKYFEKLNNYGVTILPNDILEEPIILIDISTNNVIDFISYFIHEIQHVVDFHKFSIYFLNGSYNGIYEHPLFDAYSNWSEFNAFSVFEFECYKFLDIDYNTNNLMQAVKNHENNLSDYIEQHRSLLINGQFESYDLMRILGRIYALDKYYKIENISDSYFHKYISKLFYSKKQSYVFELYHLYFQYSHDYLILQNLEVIKQIEDKIFQYY